MSQFTTLCGVKLDNRSVLASGILGVTLSSLKRVYKEGAGIVTSKSIGINPRKGHKGPVIYDYGAGLINAVGLSNPGVESFIEQNKNINIDFPLILSIFGEKVDDYALLAERLEIISCDLIEINISCPNVEDEFGRSFSYSKKLTYTITRSVKDSTSRPVIVKLSPNTPEIVEIALAAQDAGADCINVINTVGPGMVININTGYPILSNLKGGISGEAVLPLTVRYVYDLSKELSVPIIGTGGISNPESALQVLMAGAKLFGVGSAIYTRGISVFKEINQGIADFMRINKIEDLEEIVGLTHKLDEKANFYFSFKRPLYKKKRDRWAELLARPDFVVNYVKEVFNDSSRGIRHLYVHFDSRNKPAPGQFYMLWLPGIDFKPFSVLFHKGKTIGFAVAKRGNFSREIFEIEPGHPLGMLGPLGKGFDLDKNNYLMLAGGVGLAPIVFAVEELLQKNAKVTLIFGGKTAKDLEWLDGYINEKASSRFKEIDIHYITEDGSRGAKGVVTDHIERIATNINPDFALVCGPEIFIKKSAEICLSLGIDGEASIERVMKCGIGLCGSCSMDDDGMRVCMEGPVFNFKQILEFTEFGKYKRDESGRITNI